MKTKTLFCALALMATAFAVTAHAEARNYLHYKTTALRLADQASTIVTGRLVRVDDVKVAPGNRDAARFARKDNGQWQDGQDGVRREAVIRVSDVLKGSVAAGSELRVVSMRQLQFAAYDEDLRGGEALYFIAARQEDGRNVVLMDERGTISAPECNNNLAAGADFVRGYLAAPAKAAFLNKMMDAIDLKGGRLSVDACVELAWNHEDYSGAMTEEQRQRVLALARLSKPGSEERNELITAVGRHKPEGGFDALMEIMLGDHAWSTTSLASMSLEYIDRGAAIVRLLQEWDAATDNGVRTVIVRSLGLIRPKADHDGPELRNRTLQIVGSLLVAGTEKGLLREALIASRDLRSEGVHMAALKTLIDERAINGLSDVEVKGAVVALAAARKVIKGEGKNPDTVVVLAKDYLQALGNSDPVLKQVVDAAVKFPFTTLIAGADGLGH
ncbi:MAG: hypothetical protein HS108_06110 [Planctomycetes bacterium]|jgi:hypothetical protein|nr:hypothetical protein [Planctomycetota bacterium]